MNIDALVCLNLLKSKLQDASDLLANCRRDFIPLGIIPPETSFENVLSGITDISEIVYKAIKAEKEKEK